VTIVAPVGDYYEDTNNYSIGMTVSFGNVRFLFLGDAEEEAERDIMNSGADIKADVLKLAHHGSSDALSKELLEAVSPSYAVISAGLGNDYGHPHAKVLNMLRARDVKVFRTDEQGTIVATSDGHKVTWNMSPSDTWVSGWEYQDR
jgi:competence protein ComEC